MLPWLIYRDLLHGSDSTQQASHVRSTGHSHEADSISEVHLAPHANGAGARVGEARSKPAVVINFGSVGLYAQQGWEVPSLRAHMCGQILQDSCHSVQPRATGATWCCSWSSEEAERPQTGSFCSFSVSGLVVPLHRAQKRSRRGMHFLGWPQ